jgi:NTP pyrophosphatase (non-canonical NTP hydrolase)
LGHTGAPRGARSRRGREPPMDLREAQRRVDAWISQFEEGYWPPLSNLARLTEEVGELARLMNHRFGHKPKKPDEAEQYLALELADILFVLLVIANEQHIDLDDALERTLEKYRARDSDRWTRKEGGGAAAGDPEGRSPS